MAASQDVLVAGAGLIGLCTAYSLARAGHRVTLLDKDEVGSGAARGNAGEITPIQVTPMPEPEQLREIVRGLTTRRHYLNIEPLSTPMLSAFGAGFIYNTFPSRSHKTPATSISSRAAPSPLSTLTIRMAFR